MGPDSNGYVSGNMFRWAVGILVGAVLGLACTYSQLLIWSATADTNLGHTRERLTTVEARILVRDEKIDRLTDVVTELKTLIKNR